MNLTYLRRMYRADGVFSIATRDDTQEQFMVAVEHAYLDKDTQQYLPILQPGVYTCKRGMHRLDGMTQDFETFEILGVVDQHGAKHYGVLFHWGNWNTSSKGCSCVGEDFSTGDDPHDDKPNMLVEMVTNSRATFAKFMQAQAGLDTFQLTVRG